MAQSSTAPSSLFDALRPSTWFLQAGAAARAQTLVAGLNWEWRWHKSVAAGELTGYWEFSLGRWASQRDPSSSGAAWVTQFGVTPVLRWQPGGGGAAGWFVEGGIGANVLAPIYHSGDRRFSTGFNFGDHVGLGWRFGEAPRNELMLRAQHFSNAGIKEPNPGENFVQLRYTHRF